MERTLRKLLATLLTVCMVISMMSMTAFAQEEPEDLEPAPDVNDGAVLENNENEEEDEVDLTVGPTVFKTAEENIVPQAEGYNIRVRLNEELADAKFVGIVASTLKNGDTTEVIGKVDAGYKATLNIPNADVNPNSLWLGIGMKNVASLGGDGVHAISKHGLLGDDKDMALFDKLSIYGFGGLTDFADATLNVNIISADGEETPVTYEFEGTLFDEKDGKTITAKPVGDASAAWHNMVNDKHFTVKRDNADDSQIVIANGSWLQIGQERLQFEKEGDIILFANGEPVTVEDIQDMVQVVDVENDMTLAFHLTAGTKLGVSTSSAELAEDVTVTVDNISMEELKAVHLNAYLSGLRDLVREYQEGTEDLGDKNKTIIIALAGLMDSAIKLVDNREDAVEVTIKFGEESEEEGYQIKNRLNELLENAKFVGIVASTLSDGKTTTEVVGTVDAGYNATLVIPNAEVNPNSLILGIGMKDVASLGGNGVHALSKNGLLGADKDMAIFGKLSSYGFGGLMDFADAKVKADIVGVDNTTKSVTYTFKGTEFNAETSENKTITATPDAGVADAWHHMVNETNFNINRNTGADDSQIVIKNGSWLQIGQERLEFERDDENENIALFVNGQPTTIEDIQKMVQVVNTEDMKLAFHLTAGTKLGVSTSSAELAKDVTVTVDNISIEELKAVHLDAYLSGLRDLVREYQEGTEDLGDKNKTIIIALAGLMDSAVKLVDNHEGDINVTIKFECDHADSVVVDEAVEATCVADGKTEGSHCSVCGQVIVPQEVVTATGVHTYGELVWVGNRRAYHECTVCSAREDATVTVTDRVLTPATHTTNGRIEYTAVASFGEEVAEPHVWTETIPALRHTVIIDEAVEPTCTETGLTEGSHCADCDEVFVEQQVIDALGHNYGESVLAEDHATVSRTCSRCNETETADVTGVTSEVTTPATRREPGVRTYTGTATYADGTAVTVTWTEVIPRLPSGGGSSSGGSTVVIDPNDVPLVDRPMTFEDVKEEDWFHEAVQFVFNKGLMEGESETEFEPYINTTRAMVAQILYRMEGTPSVSEAADTVIPDVTTADWYHDAAVWAYSTGVYKGLDEAGTFGGDVNITREQLVEVLYRYAVSKGYAVTDSNDLSAFEDKDDIGDWATKSMEWAVGAGLIQGRTETHIVPQDNAQRCELAMILMRFMNKFAPETK